MVVVDDDADEDGVLVVACCCSFLKGFLKGLVIVMIVNAELVMFAWSIFVVRK